MKYPLGIAALVLLAGCSDSGAVKDAITEGLIDADSAKFGEITVVDGEGGKFACATVNARNSFGGYTGDQQVMLKDEGSDGWVWMGEGSEQSHQSCVDIATSLTDVDEAAQAAADAAAAGAEAAAAGQ